MEFKDAGVRANSMLSVTIDTPRNRATMPSADTCRRAAATQLAELIAFLASLASAWATWKRAAAATS